LQYQLFARIGILFDDFSATCARIAISKRNHFNELGGGPISVRFLL